MHDVFNNIYMLLDGDIEAIIEISEDFAEQMTNDLPVIVDHIDNSYFTDAKKITHKLKGSVMNFNYPVMIDAFLGLEKALLSADKMASQEYCTIIFEELEVFKKLITTIK